MTKHKMALLVCSALLMTASCKQAGQTQARVTHKSDKEVKLELSGIKIAMDDSVTFKFMSAAERRESSAGAGLGMMSGDMGSSNAFKPFDAKKCSINNHVISIYKGQLRIGSVMFGAIAAGDEVLIEAGRIFINGQDLGPAPR